MLKSKFQFQFFVFFIVLLRTNKTETDLSSMLSLVTASDTKTRDYMVEAGVLQSIQQLIQWVADFTLYLLALLPTQHAQKPDQPGVSPGSGMVIRTTEAVTLLSENIIQRIAVEQSRI